MGTAWVSLSLVDISLATARFIPMVSAIPMVPMGPVVPAVPMIHSGDDSSR